MEYVMVPVPEELLDEVREFVEWGMQLRALPAGDTTALVGTVNGADADTRRFLKVLAEDSLAGDTTTIGSAAERAGLEPTGARGDGLGGQLHRGQGGWVAVHDQLPAQQRRRVAQASRRDAPRDRHRPARRNRSLLIDSRLIDRVSSGAAGTHRG
ncbi:MAG: hypothetical protein R2695_13530 [Acidimicrobiales bacterium]